MGSGRAFDRDRLLAAFDRINDPAKGPQETLDIQNLIRAAGIGDVEEAVAVLAKFFPKSAADGFGSPAEFRHHNIFTEEAPLRRAASRGM